MFCRVLSLGARAPVLRVWKAGGGQGCASRRAAWLFVPLWVCGNSSQPLGQCMQDGPQPNTIYLHSAVARPAPFTVRCQQPKTGMSDPNHVFFASMSHIGPFLANCSA